MAFNSKRVAVIIPAYNEAASIAQVVSELVELKFNDTQEAVINQILVGDNGSNDGTAYLATEAGATVIREERKGYGFACLACLQYLATQDQAPDYVVFVDGDCSVFTPEVISLLEVLEAQNDFVVGARVAHLMHAKALSLHQRWGTQLACMLIRVLWHEKVFDLGPFRAITYPALVALQMQDERFGWTVEMQVKAIQMGLQYQETPVTTCTRVGASKISGTLRGTIGAARGIFGKIFSLYFNQTPVDRMVKLAGSKTDFKQNL